MYAQVMKVHYLYIQFCLDPVLITRPAVVIRTHQLLPRTPINRVPLHIPLPTPAITANAGSRGNDAWLSKQTPAHGLLVFPLPVILIR